jgi:hypothetical protein
MTFNRRPSLLVTSLVLVAVTATPAFAAGQSTTPTTMPAQLESGSSGGGAAALAAASCLGCHASWGLWENGNTIRALRGSYTDEVVTLIHVHWAFIMPDPDSCADMYDGPYAPSGTGHLDKTNTSADQVKDSNYAQGGQHTWTNAGAHQWKDDGVNWYAGSNGETDICKDFGL